VEPEIRFCEEAHLSKLVVTMLVRSENSEPQNNGSLCNKQKTLILMNHDTVEVLGDEQVVTA
jgi:thioredoxin reductase (NADPH)